MWAVSGSRAAVRDIWGLSGRQAGWQAGRQGGVSQQVDGSTLPLSLRWLPLNKCWCCCWQTGWSHTHAEDTTCWQVPIRTSGVSGENWRKEIGDNSTLLGVLSNWLFPCPWLLRMIVRVTMRVALKVMIRWWSWEWGKWWCDPWWNWCWKDL